MSASPEKSSQHFDPWHMWNLHISINLNLSTSSAANHIQQSTWNKHHLQSNNNQGTAQELWWFKSFWWYNTGISFPSSPHLAFLPLFVPSYLASFFDNVSLLMDQPFHLFLSTEESLRILLSPTFSFLFTNDSISFSSTQCTHMLKT